MVVGEKNLKSFAWLFDTDLEAAAMLDFSDNSLFSRQIPNLMLKPTFVTTANSEPLTANGGLKFAVDCEKAKLNVPNDL